MLTGPISGWEEGGTLSSLGPVIKIGQVNDSQHMLLFPSNLILLEASPRMSGFICKVHTTLQPGNMENSNFEPTKPGKWVVPILENRLSKATILVKCRILFLDF